MTDDATIMITNLIGQAVFKASAEAGTISFGEELSEGIYLMQVLHADGSKETFKLIKSE